MRVFIADIFYTSHGASKLAVFRFVISLYYFVGATVRTVPHNIKQNVVLNAILRCRLSIL